MKIFLIFLTVLILTGCYSSDKNKSSYISPLKYKGIGCTDINKEIERTGEAFWEVNKAHSGDMASSAIMFGLIGLAVASNSDGYAEERRLRGELDALIAAASEQECELSSGATSMIDKIKKYDERQKAIRETDTGPDDDD